MTDDHQYAPATVRNRDCILDVLRDVPPTTGIIQQRLHRHDCAGGHRSRDPDREANLSDRFLFKSHGVLWGEGRTAGRRYPVVDDRGWMRPRPGRGERTADGRLAGTLRRASRKPIRRCSMKENYEKRELPARGRIEFFDFRPLERDRARLGGLKLIALVNSSGRP